MTPVGERAVIRKPEHVADLSERTAPGPFARSVEAVPAALRDDDALDELSGHLLMIWEGVQRMLRV